MATSDQQPTRPRLVRFKHDLIEVSVMISAEKLSLSHNRQLIDKVVSTLREYSSDEKGRLTPVPPKRPLILHAGAPFDYKMLQALRQESTHLHNLLREEIADGDLVVTSTGKVANDELIRWWETRGVVPAYLHSCLWKPAKSPQEGECNPLAVEASAPYLADLFELVNACYFRYWKDWTEGTTKPDEEHVIDWLMSQEPGLRKQTAQAIFEFSRPPEARKTGRPKGEKSF